MGALYAACMRRIETEFASFKTRPQRTEFVARRYKSYLVNSVLDVGCFEAPLRDSLKGVSYVGIDIVGKPDFVVDLESVDRLDFDENAFNCVICIEVLEHLDGLHKIFDELVRVSQRYVIVSLPNCWCSARRHIERGAGAIAHYGLPASQPADRHKWFFNVSEAREFFESKKSASLKLIDLTCVEKPRIPIVRWARKFIYNGEKYNNRYTHTIFAVFEKC